MDAPTLASASAGAGEASKADPKAEKELEKTRRAAIKDLSSVFKTWYVCRGHCKLLVT
jgi:hypothetical protein